MGKSKNIITVREPGKFRPTYENFEVECPECKYWNIYNRATDLQSFDLIAGREVTCLNEKCKQVFWIGGDLVCPKWKLILLENHELKSKKLYSNCVLNACKAFEMYFAHYLRVTLVYDLIKEDDDIETEKLNELLKLLYERTRKMTFHKMRSIFMNFVLKEIRPKKFSESEKLINEISDHSNKKPKVSEIKKSKNQKLADLLIRLGKTEINILRNNVVHKNGYRPTLMEIEEADNEAANILFGLNRIQKLEKSLLRL